jgi:hypothetical protein
VVGPYLDVVSARSACVVVAGEAGWRGAAPGPGVGWWVGVEVVAATSVKSTLPPSGRGALRAPPWFARAVGSGW